MRKPYKKNKKRIDPRYFLEETVEENMHSAEPSTQPSWDKFDSLMKDAGSEDQTPGLLDPSELLDLLINQIRQGGKDLYGRRSADGSIQDLMNMSIGQLRDILWDQANSYEQQSIDDMYRDEEDSKLGYEDDLSKYERMPKFRGHGKSRGLAEEKATNAKQDKTNK